MPHSKQGCFANSPKTSTSSTRQSTPSRPSRMFCILFRNTSGALEIPKGSYLPVGVMKVVSGRDSLASGICQNPLFVSSLLNTVAPASCPRISSTFENTLIQWLQIHTDSNLSILFWDYHYPRTPWGGSSTLEMTPSFSMLSTQTFVIVLGKRDQFLSFEMVPLI